MDIQECQVIEKIGEGSCGEVFRCVYDETPIAMKCLKVSNMNNNDIHDVCREISLLKRLRHPNTVLFKNNLITKLGFVYGNRFKIIDTLYNYRVYGRKISLRCTQEI